MSERADLAGADMQAVAGADRHNGLVPTTQTKACLRIDGDHGSVAKITDAIGLAPTSSHDICDPRSARDPRPWQNLHWSLDSGLPDTAPLEEHLAALCDILEPHATALHQLRADGYVLDWFCLVGIDGTQGGVVLSPMLLQRLAPIPAELALDIYAT
jgi:hypothetical protein